MRDGYNRNVSAWLGRHFHLPLARRGRRRLSIVAAFAVSTVFHAWLAWIPLDTTLAASMASFFAFQGVIGVVERSWPRFARRPETTRRVWTLGWLLATSPLFVEPFSRILEL